MRSYLKIILICLPLVSDAQPDLTDSLRKVFFNSKSDSVLYDAAIHLYDYYEELNRDSALFYADQCVQLSRKNNKRLNEAYSHSRKAYQEINMGRYANALENLLEAFSVSENKENESSYWSIHPLRAESQKKIICSFLHPSHFWSTNAGNEKHRTTNSPF